MRGCGGSHGNRQGTHDSHWLELCYDGVREHADLMGEGSKGGQERWL